MGISQGLNGAEVIGNPQITKRFLSEGMNVGIAGVVGWTSGVHEAQSLVGRT
ncbi:hypothetical protein [Paraburkholderia fungorum]|uniref:hypothetical protein n=1 Tax=Paraburkholderia fungorum TaxID=134537 RepID=UPI000A6E9B6E|nr:hypothetical protein [Paraburkholderia fungorum]MBB5543620.1 hypothetical protein [Paraburkholderia fungorum]